MEAPYCCCRADGCYAGWFAGEGLMRGVILLEDTEGEGEACVLER